MKPSDKDKDFTKSLDVLSESLTGVKRTDAIKSDTCVFCKQPANKFRDELSRKEFTISGMCQKCQDEVFGEEE